MKYGVGNGDLKFSHSGQVSIFFNTEEKCFIYLYACITFFIILYYVHYFGTEEWKEVQVVVYTTQCQESK